MNDAVGQTPQGYRWSQIAVQLRLDRSLAKQMTNCSRYEAAARLVDWRGGDLATTPHMFRVNGYDGDRVCRGGAQSCGCEHPEAKLITDFLLDSGKLARVAGLTLLTTFSPCEVCAHLIVRSGLAVQVYYIDQSQHSGIGIDILRRGLIDVRRIEL